MDNYTKNNLLYRQHLINYYNNIYRINQINKVNQQPIQKPIQKPIQQPIQQIKKPIIPIKNKEILPQIDLDNIDLIRNKQIETFNYLKSLGNEAERLKYLNSLKVVYSFTENEHNLSSSVNLLENYIVCKTCFSSGYGNFLFNNEIASLAKSSGFPHFPILFGYDKYNLKIYMSYCGKTLKYHNLPDNWKEQFNEIKIITENIGVDSNDVLERNICCLGDEIKLIDFGLDNPTFRYLSENIAKLYSYFNELDKSKTKNNKTNQIKERTERTENVNCSSYIKYYPNWKTNLIRSIEKNKKINLIYNELLKNRKKAINNYNKAKT